jgi:hypothetical protein
MQNAITTLRIRNFKSIKDVTLHPRRVNLIIGEPNVGKSNVLEAMSLLGGMVYEQQPRFMAGMVRYERAHQLFYDSLINETISVDSNLGTCLAGHLEGRNSYRAWYMQADAFAHYGEIIDRLKFYNSVPPNNFFSKIYNLQRSNPARSPHGRRDFNENGDSPDSGRRGFDDATPDIADTIKIRPYLFARYTHSDDFTRVSYLRPPHGTNLKQVLQAHPNLFENASALFRQDAYRLGMRAISNELEAVKTVRGIIYSIPYANIADTLQRLIFYLAAIESNDDAVILFEEPEAHSYPVYVSQLGRRIAESRNNQFFVATHSPYLITEILETMLPDDEQAGQVAIFVAYYEDYQTKLRQLTDEEMRGIRADSLDVFYNMDRLVNPQA